MANIGVSKPYYAVHNVSQGAVSYTGCASMGKLTEIGIGIEIADSNDFYADNAIAETDKTFAGGTLTMSTADLSQSVAKAILGLTENALGTITGITDTGVKELLYNDSQSTPYLGVGFVVKKKVDGVYKWRSIVLAKVMFNTPADAATTQGETIEWQTPELEATILRDADQGGLWKSEATFTTEAQAEAYIQYKLSGESGGAEDED